MDNQPRRADINISSIPVSGVGGLAFLVIAVVMAAVLPLARWVLLLGAVGGALLGAAKILVRRYRGALVDWRRWSGSTVSRRFVRGLPETKRHERTAQHGDQAVGCRALTQRRVTCAPTG